MRRIIAVLLALTLPAPVAPARADALQLAPPVIAPIVRHFEPPPTPFSAGHRGMDFAVPAGTAVRASEGGVVTFAGQVGGLLHLTIDHGGLRTTYSFLSAIAVKAGEQVSQDQPVARSGSGHPGSEEPHLHFSLREGSTYLDPEPALLETIRRQPWRVIRLAG